MELFEAVLAMVIRGGVTFLIHLLAIIIGLGRQVVLVYRVGQNDGATAADEAQESCKGLQLSMQGWSILSKFVSELAVLYTKFISSWPLRVLSVQGLQLSIQGWLISSKFISKFAVHHVV
jgi:hypothetical protein